MFVNSPVIAAVFRRVEPIDSLTAIPSPTGLFHPARSVQLRASSLGKRTMAVSLLVLLASVRCQLTTVEASTQAAEASVAKVQPVAGDNDLSGERVRVFAGADAIPRFSFREPMRVLSISVYDIASEELLWVAVPETFMLRTGQVMSGTPQLDRASETDSFVDSESTTEIRESIGHPVTEFAYGSAPDGFHQLVPVEGFPPPLTASGQYLLVIDGEFMVRVPFEGRGNASD
jgi:hypothetical protein